MRSYRSLALKELWAQKITSLLILIAVILSTTMTTVVGRSVGILAAMREKQAIALGGDRYVTFVQMDAQQIEALRQDGRLSYTGVTVAVGTLKLNSVLSLGLTEYRDGSLDAFPTLTRLREGRLPSGAMEIALPEDVLQFLGFTGGVGDPITLCASKALRHGVSIESFEFTAEFTLTGILESNYLGYSSGAVQGIVGEGTAAALLPSPYRDYANVNIRTARKAGFQEVVDDLVQTLGIHELDIMYNTPYLNALGIDCDAGGAKDALSDEGFPLMTAAGVMVDGLVLLAAGLVIFNILKIAVSRRARQYGTLRAIGAEKAQLYAVVVTELLLLCGAGIPLGLLAGYWSAAGILQAATGLLSPEIFLVQDSAELERLIAANSTGKGLYLLLSAAVTLAFAFLAALPAARAAARVSPVAAMSGSSVKIKRRNRRSRRIRSFEAYYARLNLRRSPGRTAITVLSLAMSIAVFIALQGFVGLLNTASAESQHLGDYSLVNEAGGFPPEELAALEADENVEAVAALQFSLYFLDGQSQPDGILFDRAMQPGETLQIVGLNRTYWQSRFGGSLSPEQMRQLLDGEGCVVRNPVPLTIEGNEVARTEIPQGSEISVAGRKLKVLETLDGYEGYFSVGNSGFVNGVQIIVNEDLYREFTGQSCYAELLPLLRQGADRETFDLALERLCQRVPGTVCLSYEEADRQLAESFAQINLLAWGLILFVGLIGVLNIINTVYTNIHTRLAEIGIQRAVGMSIAGLYRTFLWEGVYHALLAALFGWAAGYLCTVLVESAQTGSLHPAAPPLLPMAEAAGLALAACLAATCLPLRKISRMDIVTSIEAVE